MFIVFPIPHSSEFVSQLDGAEGSYCFHWNPGLNLGSGQCQKKIISYKIIRLKDLDKCFRSRWIRVEKIQNTSIWPHVQYTTIEVLPKGFLSVSDLGENFSNWNCWISSKINHKFEVKEKQSVMKNKDNLLEDSVDFRLASEISFLSVKLTFICEQMAKTSFYSIVVSTHIWFECLCWRLVIG